jgi:hypothetical protein
LQHSRALCDEKIDPSYLAWPYRIFGKRAEDPEEIKLCLPEEELPSSCQNPVRRKDSRFEDGKDATCFLRIMPSVDTYGNSQITIEEKYR